MHQLTYWFFRYLETERDYSSEEVMVTMVVAVLVLASGYFIGGAMGDPLFGHTPRGRLIVATSAMVLGTILLFFTLNIPLENKGVFLLLLSATALFVPFPSPNIVSTINDIALPEMRSAAALVLAAHLVPRDIETLRRQLRERAEAALGHGSAESEPEAAWGWLRDTPWMAVR